MGTPTTVTNGCIVREYLGQPIHVPVWNMGLGRLLLDNRDGTYAVVIRTTTRLTAKQALDWVDEHAG